MLKAVLVEKGNDLKKFAKKECSVRMVRTSLVSSFSSLYRVFYHAWLVREGV